MGLGGGVLLISVMPGVVPAGAVVPVHGAVQLASNASRVWLGRSHLDWTIIRPFVAGALVGAAAGLPLVSRASFEQLPLWLGLFILVVTWAPAPTGLLQLRAPFAVIGALQTWLSLFVGATGPLTSPFLLRQGMPRDPLVVTVGGAMTVTHVLKLVVFGVTGFDFVPYLALVAAMVGGVVAGSWVGTRLRGHVPDTYVRRGLRLVITVLALRLVLGSLLGGPTDASGGT